MLSNKKRTKQVNFFAINRKALIERIVEESNEIWNKTQKFEDSEAPELKAYDERIALLGKADRVISKSKYSGILFKGNYGNIIAKPFKKPCRKATDEEIELYELIIKLVRGEV